MREIEVLKFRGGDHFLGRHDMEITRDGIVVRPRTELLLAKRTEVGQATHDRRVSPASRTRRDARTVACSVVATLLLGFSGSGKTLLGQHFLEAGAQKQEPGLYFGFYEPPERLIEAAEQVGIRDARATTSRSLSSIQWQPRAALRPRRARRAAPRATSRRARSSAS